MGDPFAVDADRGVRPDVATALGWHLALVYQQTEQWAAGRVEQLDPSREGASPRVSFCGELHTNHLSHCRSYGASTHLKRRRAQNDSHYI